MNPLEIVRFLEELIRSETKVIAFSVVSVGITLVGVYLFKKWVLPKNDSEKDLALKNAEIARKDADIARKDAEIGNLERKLDDRDRKLAAVEERSTDSTKICDALKTEKGQQATELDKLRSDNARLIQKNQGLDSDQKAATKKAADVAADLANRSGIWKRNAAIFKKNEDYYKTRKAFYKKQYAILLQKLKQIEISNKQIEETQGKFWEFPVKTPVPPFRPRRADSATIIAVTNLKGGVGKTTLTASIALAYRQAKKRVLVVDLDHQGSLTKRCLPEEQISALRKEGTSIENVFKVRAEFAAVAMKNRAFAKEHDFDVLPASENLFDVEEHVKAQWLMNLTGFDIRYILRLALHDAVFQNGYDIILLDCPPRWTPASINAMTCADFVLVPMMLDAISAEAVPRLLTWLRHLKAMKIAPDLEILGVLGNNAYPRKALVRRERAIWEASPTKCADAWKTPVYHFENVIRKFATTEPIAALEPKLHQVFADLVAELETRRGQHERVELTAVS